MRRSALLIGAAASGAGKTTATLGLLRALRRSGRAVAAAKSGPDYIDREFLAAACRSGAATLDAFAMSPEALRARAREHLDSEGADLLVIEGAMGVFDGALGARDAPAVGIGASARVAAALGAPIVLVVDASHRGQSALVDPVGVAAALAAWTKDAPILAGVILNKTVSERHAEMARVAIAATGFAVFGAIARDAALAAPSRHLGLTLAREHADLDGFLDRAADAVEAGVDLDALAAAAGRLPLAAPEPPRLAPIGQRIAVASDDAFAFVYPHLLADWRRQGAEILPFSPLADAPPDPAADAVFLPGGYPELHGRALAEAARFRGGMTAAAAKGVRIYGECGGYMVLGEGLTDGDGARWPMLGLLPLETRMTPRRTALGYRRLQPLAGAPFDGPLPSREVLGHEFHYAEIVSEGDGPRLFEAADASGAPLGAIGLARGSVSGSFAHVIAPA